MYFIRFNARANHTKQPSISYAGTAIACWIDLPDQSDAEKRARVVIEDQGWTIESVDDSYEITELSYSDDKDGLKYYEQALIDREVFVFYPWK